MSKVQILVADEHDFVRQGIAATLGKYPDLEISASADNDLRAVRSAETHTPDIVLMNIKLPALDGVEPKLILSTSCTKARDPPIGGIYMLVKRLN